MWYNESYNTLLIKSVIVKWSEYVDLQSETA